MVESVSGKMASLGGLPGLQPSASRESASAGAPRAVADKPAAGSAGAEAGLVSEGRAAVRDMAAQPLVDGSRVAALRDAIASGSYTPDPDRIADAMIRSEPGLARS